ncbi:MAG: pyridoxal phosphate-dependent aminotransferase [Myxococcales bacterium FL481]|nr:MAG: pyridoxal phosphate-dependent aminotransferase [Myxococcales bacterium FL481]
MAPTISRRAQLMPASPIRKLAPYAEAAKRQGVRVYHLNIGQPDIETPEPMRRRLAAIDDRVLAYTPSGGTPEALATFRRYYRSLGIELDESELLVTTGGSEACLFAMLAVADPDDEVLVVEPFYTNYNAFATLGNLRLRPLTSRGEDGFHLPPPEAWQAARSPKCKAVLLCNPSNPTGTVYTRQELEWVAQFCREHELFLLVDEVYREFVYDGGTSLSALSLAGAEELVVVIDSASKRYSACGIRLGCVVSRNQAVMDAALRMAQARLSAPGLAQAIAAGIDEIPSAYNDTVLAEYAKRRDVLYEGLSAIPGVFLRKPEGAFYLMPRLPVDDAEHFCEWMLSDFSHDGATVMMAPAPGFYATPGLGRDEVRIAYVLNTTELTHAVAVLAAGLQAYGERGTG